MSLEQDGIVTRELFACSLPDEARRRKGPYVVLECYQEIPCNPCTTSCKLHALAQETINALPQPDWEKCTGCGRCVGICPGQACFVLDETAEPGRVRITFPYELLPLPKEGMTVEALGRDGLVKGEAVVRKVRSGKALDKTHVVTVSVDAALIYDVRSIRVIKEAAFNG